MTHPIWTRLLWIYFLIGAISFFFDLIKYLSLVPSVGLGTFTDTDGMIDVMSIVLLTTLISLIFDVILLVVCFLRKKIALVLVPLLTLTSYFLNCLSGLPILKINDIPEEAYMVACLFILIIPLTLITIVVSNKEEFDN